MFRDGCKKKLLLFLIFSFSKIFNELCRPVTKLDFYEPDSEMLTSNLILQTSWFGDSIPKHAGSRGAVPARGLAGEAPPELRGLEGRSFTDTKKKSSNSEREHIFVLILMKKNSICFSIF